jgi:hypothetical protein
MIVTLAQVEGSVCGLAHIKDTHTRFWAPMLGATKTCSGNGVKSVARIRREMMISCKLLNQLVPRAGVEPARPYGQRILSP